MAEAEDADVLVDLLGDADPDVRLRCALELGERRHADAADALVHRFGVERDLAIRETLTWAVLRIADAAMPLVRAALDSPRWLARLQAAHTLSKLGAREDGVLLRPLVADPLECVAARAAWAVAQCRDAGAVPALVGQLSRGSSAHRTSTSVALEHLAADAVAPLVGAVRRSPDPAVRAHAADTLALIGAPAADHADEALAAVLRDDPDPDVRTAALNALGQLRTAHAWQVVLDTSMADPARVRAGSAEQGERVLAGRLLERRPRERRLRRDADVGPDGRTLAASRAALDADPASRTAPPVTRWPQPDPTLVRLEGGPWAAELVPPLALQVEVCRPQHLARADVPAEELARVHDAALADALADGRSDALARRIAAGRVEQHVHEVVLLEQASAADPGATIADLLRGTEVVVAAFTRLPPSTGHSASAVTQCD